MLGLHVHFRPYICIAEGEHPDLTQRLCLAAAQMLVYHERFEPDKAALLVYEALFVSPFLRPGIFLFLARRRHHQTPQHR